MSKSSAQFIYYFETKEGIKFLLIEDLNHGKKSVTNDIENVVSDIAETEKIDNCIILYKDSDGIWDQYDHHKIGFTYLGMHSPQTAIDKYIENLKVKA